MLLSHIVVVSDGPFYSSGAPILSLGQKIAPWLDDCSSYGCRGDLGVIGVV